MENRFSELEKADREASLSWKTVSDVEIQLRRPTPLEACELKDRIRLGGIDALVNHIDSASYFVNDWRGVKESDLFDSGDDLEIDFSRQALMRMCHRDVAFANEMFGEVYDLADSVTKQDDAEKKH